MNDFSLWFNVGMEHILNVSAYDHLLFVTLLVIAFEFGEWRKLILVITAFTLGHSASLALSTFDVIYVPAPWIEALIGLTILVSALFAIYNFRGSNSPGLRNYVAGVVIFGAIHGLGFSFLLKAMLGKGQSVILPLLYFNLGLELGQLIIVAIVLVFSLLLVQLLKWPITSYKLITSCIIALIAAKITLDRFLELF